MKGRDKVAQLLKEDGAVLVRSKKHEIWRLSNGKTFVQSQTPSDVKEGLASLADLKKLLGIQTENDGRQNARRAKKRTNGRDTTIHYTKSVNTSLADQLSIKGVTESALREDNEMLKNQNELLIAELSDVCLFCRLKNWLKLNLSKT